jgi:hypothetical protein
MNVQLVLLCVTTGYSRLSGGGGWKINRGVVRTKNRTYFRKSIVKSIAFKKKGIKTKITYYLTY